MNYKEFTAYKNSILSEVKVNEDGSTENDYHFRYTVSYLDAENISRSNDLIAKTMTEAVYRSCWMYMALFMPDKSTVDANPEESLEKLKKLSNFSNFKFLEINDDGKNQSVSMAITIDDKIHNFTVKAASENREPYRLIDGKVDNNIITTWLTTEDNSTICQIYYSPFSINSPFNDKLSAERYYAELSEYQVRGAMYAHAVFGLAAVSKEDEYNGTLGKEISYSRALYEKTELDIKFLKMSRNNIKNAIENATSIYNETGRIIKKIKRRQVSMHKKLNKYKVENENK